MEFNGKGGDILYEQQRVAVIGAGAAGMMSAIYAAQNGALVTVFEKNDRVGKKLAITGKGRCNVTNDCDTQELLKNIISNPKFLYAAFSNFDTQDTKAFFESLGVPLKTERGRRVFPVSDKAMDIVLALKKCMLDYGVTLKHERVTEILELDGNVSGIKTDRATYEFDAVIVVCFPSTLAFYEEISGFFFFFNMFFVFLFFRKDSEK